MDRRDYLSTAAVTTGLVVAGCTGTGGTEGESDDGRERTEDEDHEDEPAGPDTVDSPPDDDTADDEKAEDDSEAEDEEEHPPLVGTFDDFETIGPWQEFLGSMAVDEGRSVIGSQSVLMGPNEDGTARIRRELEEPIDVRDVAPGIATTADGPGWTLIQLQDDDGNYNEYGQFVPAGTPMVRKNFGLTRVRGDPDPSRVTLIQFVRWFVGESTQFWVDDLHFVPEPDRGKVVLLFRGGHRSHYEQARAILAEYGFTGTVLAPTERVGAGGSWLSHAHLDELDGDGWTIGCYGARGRRLPGLSGGQLEREIVQPAAWLDEHDHGDGPRVFAFPDAQYDERSYELVREHYDLAFSAQSRSQGYAGNPHLWTVAESPSDPDAATELVDWAADIGGITAIPFDDLGGESLAALQATVSRLAERSSTGELELLSPAELLGQYVFHE